MKIGYARVSTYEQSLDLQIDALKAVGVEDAHIHMDKLSGADEGPERFATGDSRHVQGFALDVLSPCEPQGGDSDVAQEAQGLEVVRAVRFYK
jgi:hypothetical protein